MSEVPEIIRYFRKGRYLLAEVRGEEEAVPLARLIGPRKRAVVVSLTTLQKERKRKNPTKKKKKAFSESAETTCESI